MNQKAQQSAHGRRVHTHTLGIAIIGDTAYARMMAEVHDGHTQTLSAAVYFLPQVAIVNNTISSHLLCSLNERFISSIY